MRLLSTFTCAMLLSSAAAYAAPFTLEFTGIIASSGTSGISEGDTVTLDLIADNGGSNDLSQTWNLADLAGFTIHAGTYTATYSQVYPFPSTGNFVTDASGNIISVAFYGTDPSSQNSDNFTASFVGDNVAGDASFMDSLGGGDYDRRGHLEQRIAMECARCLGA